VGGVLSPESIMEGRLEAVVFAPRPDFGAESDTTIETAYLLEFSNRLEEHWRVSLHRPRCDDQSAYGKAPHDLTCRANR